MRNDRNEFICNLANSISGNVLVLFNFVEKHGIPLFQEIGKQNKKEAYLICGKTEIEEREQIRNIVDKSGKYLCKDNCESLGKWNPFANYKHIDTNCYALKTEVAIKICHAFHGGWGQDRVFYRAIEQYFPQYDCTGEYTLNYRLEGNVGSVSPEFFKFGNEQVKQKFNDFPWRQNAKDHI